MKQQKRKIKFDWDKGNRTKSRKKHNVAPEETEEAFSDKNAIVDDDKLHSDEEPRFILIGKTKKGRLLYIAFTVRGKLIRPISSRPTDKKEVELYEKRINNSKV
jgi:uncharacterized DUF497 family protein